MLINNMNALASFIKDRRTHLKMSQMQVAELVGIRQSTVSVMETKPEKNQIITLHKILSALELEIHLIPKETLNNQIKSDDKW